MRIVVIGGSASGKSEAAERRAVELREQYGSTVYYVAAMVPRDDEDRKRIARHRRLRADRGFVTVECAGELCSRVTADPSGIYLIETATAMLANAMFGEGDFVYRPEAWSGVLADLRDFGKRVRAMIVVCDEVGSDAKIYDEMTETYRRGLARLVRGLVQDADEVRYSKAGVERALRGAGRVMQKQRDVSEEPAFSEQEAGPDRAQAEYAGAADGQQEGCEQVTEVVIGGAYQGKSAYVRKKYGLTPCEILDCTEHTGAEELRVFLAGTGAGAETDRHAVLPERTGSKATAYRCVLHLERYLRGCVKRGETPEAESFSGNCVVVCEDITCGIVPLEAADRQWRELTGRFLTELAERAGQVTRVSFGIAERLK